MNELQRRKKVAEYANSLPIKENQPNQKFPRGARVKIDNVMPPVMRHFPCGFEAIVKYTYAQKFWGNDIKSYSVVRLNEAGEPINTIAWYEENQMTLIDNDIKKGIQIIEAYQKMKCDDKND